MTQTIDATLQLDTDPPGLIGLSARDAVVLLRFDERFTMLLPSDGMGSLVDMSDGVGATMPLVVNGVSGYAREFDAALASGLRSSDIDSGSTLLNRDCSVRALLRWDMADQDAYASNGTIICRGVGASSSEYVAFGLELLVVDMPTRLGEVRWFWQKSDGTAHTCTGGQFYFTDDSACVLITATRRWVSSDEVRVRYYIGDRLLAESIETVGDIGGGTTGQTTIGGRITDGANGWLNFFDGAIDELAVYEKELTFEEVENEWKRIKLWQPLGEQLVIDSHPNGWPFTLNPDSSIGRETRLWGYGLGYAAAAAENFRSNMMPDRAYGRVLERWEEITRQPPKRFDSIETRRLRVIGHLRARAGVSPPGVRTALSNLFGVDEADVDVIAFSNTIEDDFATLLTRRWRESHAGVWSAAGSLQASIAGGTDCLFNGAAWNWRTLLTGADGPERLGGSYGTQFLAKLTPTTLPDGSEFGLAFYDVARQDVLLFGIRRSGANYQIIHQKMVDGVMGAATVMTATTNVPHWFVLKADEPGIGAWAGESARTLVNHSLLFSTTSADADDFAGDSTTFPMSIGRIGFYVRTYATAALSGALTVNIDDAKWRCPNGKRPFYFYAYRDPGLGGSYDLDGANSVLRRLKQSHTHAAAIDSLDVLCDTAGSGAGLGPCGGF